MTASFFGAFNFKFFDLLAQGIAIDSQDIGGVGLVPVGLLNHNVQQGFFHSADDEAIQITVVIFAHVLDIVFDCKIEPVLQEGICLAANVVHELKR